MQSAMQSSGGEAFPKKQTAQRPYHRRQPIASQERQRKSVLLEQKKQWNENGVKLDQKAGRGQKRGNMI